MYHIFAKIAPKRFKKPVICFCISLSLFFSLALSEMKVYWCLLRDSLWFTPAWVHWDNTDCWNMSKAVWIWRDWNGVSHVECLGDYALLKCMKGSCTSWLYILLRLIQADKQAASSTALALVVMSLLREVFAMSPHMEGINAKTTLFSREVAQPVWES